jgi:hypothetical protein
MTFSRPIWIHSKDKYSLHSKSFVRAIYSNFKDDAKWMVGVMHDLAQFVDNEFSVIIETA